MIDKSDKNPNQESGNNDSEELRIPASSIVAPGKETYAKEEDDPCVQISKAYQLLEQRMRRLWSYVPAPCKSSAFWTAIATVFIAATSFYQWRAIRGQLTVMRDTVDQMKGQNWVAAKTFRAERPVFTQHARLSTEVGKQDSLKVSVEMKNVGQNTGIDMHSSTQIWIADNDSFNTSIAWLPCPVVGFIGPTDMAICENAPVSVTADEIKVYKRDGKRLYVRVYSYYGENIEKDVWLSQSSCMFYNFGQAGVNFTDCANGNSTWENNSGRKNQDPPRLPEGAPPAEAPKKSPN